MKLTIIAILLIIGGIPNLAKTENRMAGIVCILVGVVMIAAKVFIAQEKEQNNTTIEVEIGHNRKNDEAAYERMALRGAYDTFILRWKPIVDEHYRLNLEAERLYVEANKAGDVEGPIMQRVIELCQQDICLEEQFRQYEKEKIQADLHMGYTDITTMPRAFAGYPSFKRLAIIYEKQHKYEEAIAVCQCAIEAGRLDDGTKGQMPGRLVKLQGKLEKQRRENATEIDMGNPFL